METRKIIIVLIAALVLIFACKKKTTTPAPTPVPDPPTVTKTVDILLLQATPNNSLNSVYFRTKCGSTLVDSTSVQSWNLDVPAGDLCSIAQGSSNKIYLNVTNHSSYRFEVCLKTSSVAVLGYFDFDANGNRTGNSGINAAMSTTAQVSSSACDRYAIKK